MTVAAVAAAAAAARRAASRRSHLMAFACSTSAFHSAVSAIEAMLTALIARNAAAWDSTRRSTTQLREGGKEKKMGVV